MEKVFEKEDYKLVYSEHFVENKILWESHCHARFELIAVLEGGVMLETEGVRRPLSKGQLLVLPPLLYHSIIAEQRCTYRRVTVLFDSAMLPPVLKEAFISKALLFPVLSSSLLSSLEAIAPLADTPYYTPLFEAVLLQIFYEYTSLEPKEESGVKDASLLRILDYVEAHLCEPLSLDGIAAHLAISKSSLCHLFRQKMNISLKQYVLQKRLALADKLLREGVPPTEVATRISYEGYANFYRSYRKRFGHAPSRKK